MIVLVALHPYPSPQAIPLANAFLKSCLGDSQVEITLLDFFIGQDVAGCVSELLALQPSAIGFSMYVWNRSMCREIALELRTRTSGIQMFAGGPEATADPDGVLAETPFDFLVIGEGESSFAEVCSHLASGEVFADIPGVAVRGKNSAGFITAPAAIDLDTIPSPWLTGILDAGSYRGILWQLSRGCSFACDYCFDARDGSGVRRFSLERIETELRHFVDNSVAQIFVLDSTFNQDAQRAKIILKLIRKIAPGIHFHFEVRSEFIDREMARLFAEITCSLQIGLQSSNPQVLKNVGRAFKLDDFTARITLLNQSGAVFGFDLIYGLPDDTYRGFCESLDFALSLYPNHLDIFPLAILPGTALAARSSSIGLNHRPAPPYTLISSPSFSEDEMKQAQALATACDIFYTRGKAVAWFNSVISSLSLTPSAFLQLFAVWLSGEKGPGIIEADLDDHEISQMQRSFLKKLYEPKKLTRLLPVVLDLIDYHHHYAAALLAPTEVPINQQIRMPIVKMTGWLATSARLAVFQYEIMDILEAGELDIRAFTDHFRKVGSWAVIYPAGDGIRTESLIEPYFQFLKQLDGRTQFGQIAGKLVIPDDEILSFLEFAIAEGLIVLSN